MLRTIKLLYLPLEFSMKSEVSVYGNLITPQWKTMNLSSSLKRATQLYGNSNGESAKETMLSEMRVRKYRPNPVRSVHSIKVKILPYRPT